MEDEDSKSDDDEGLFLIKRFQASVGYEIGLRGFSLHLIHLIDNPPVRSSWNSSSSDELMRSSASDDCRERD